MQIVNNYLNLLVQSLLTTLFQMLIHHTAPKSGEWEEPNNIPASQQGLKFKLPEEELLPFLGFLWVFWFPLSNQNMQKWLIL